MMAPKIYDLIAVTFLTLYMLSIRFINYPEFVRYAIVVVYLILAIVRLIVYFVNSKNDWLTLQLHPGKQLM